MVMNMDDFMKKEQTCKVCTKKFTSLLVRKSKQPVVKSDSDFCLYYEKETPFFYHVFICPECGYTFLESFKKDPPPGLREKLTSLPDVFSEKRDASAAELLYKRAIDIARQQKEDDQVLASLHHYLAWAYRFKGDKEKEKTTLSEALAYYRGVYENINVDDPFKVMYLIGDLYGRLGDKNEAVKWFSRVANDKSASQAMRHRSREAWQQLRE